MARSHGGGPKPSVSTIEPVTRALRVGLVVSLLATACSTVASGPPLPRPTPDVPGSSTSTAAPVTTAAPRVSAVTGPTCPSVFCLSYHIEPGATWADGTPVTPDDFRQTVTFQLGPGVQEAEPGYALIDRVETVDENTALVSFSQPYGPWPTLFQRLFRSGHPFQDIREADTTGAFTFADWVEGETVILERDPEWWADRDPLSQTPLGDVRQVSFVFVDDAEEMLDALARGEVDVITTRADAATVQDLEAMEAVDHATSAGPFWEHIDFNHLDPMLSRPWLREAMALAINRDEILDRTVRLAHREATVLDNTVWMTGTPEYESHFTAGFDPVQAAEILSQNGCAPGEDGIQVCDGTRLSFIWATTNDDPWRREIFESARDDLAEIGIELVGSFRSPSDLVNPDFLFGGPQVWQLINFSWRAHADPHRANSTYYCGQEGTLNVNHYCSEEVAELIRQTGFITDQAERADLYNRADSLYLGDFAVIPLFQKPTVMAWSNVLTGPQPNNTLSSDLWNLASWSGKEEIVVALNSEPLEIDPLSTTDDNANLIMSPLLYGAFGMRPSHERVPVLVDSVDVIGSGS